MRRAVWLSVVAACGGSSGSPIGARPGTGGPPDASSPGPGDASTVDGAASSTDAGQPRDPGFVQCGATRCTRSPGPASTFCCIQARGFSTCTPDTFSSCGGHRIACDESGDCPEAGKCCAEENNSGPGSGHIVTSCRASCITNAPHVQVCATDGECENGGPCRAFDCGDGAPALRYCAKPDFCTL